ncbi:hypothetical protein VCUG_00477 [Vavraia culicis subsp. floridensis]|uniref:Ribosomal protein L37 n=1 Tax=Vavraia culicis (isolate floridensis) TaxID=948595 RepID=L2GWP7_VAVCU|nr:uncharacterized protein VCUG_00477 [Vavraia culicis subsp. floridensis]ELA48054.1 hypothetical protein VCUG_00477 [Vavraia culicis subsp. floridensis]
MTKGTSSFGKKNKHNHTFCIRCGKTSFNKQKRTCSACAYPAPKWKRPAGYKAKQRKNVNIRNRHMKRSLKSARSGFKGDPVMKAILSKYEVKN